MVAVVQLVSSRKVEQCGFSVNVVLYCLAVRTLRVAMDNGQDGLRNVEVSQSGSMGICHCSFSVGFVEIQRKLALPKVWY